MLELKLTKERLFLKVLEAILDLADVANVHCFSTGLKLQAVDTEHIAVITLLFLAEDFEHYHCDENFSMGIPIDAMVKATRCADKDDIVTIKVDDEVFETITLSFESPKENCSTDCHFKFVDAKNDLFEIPDWQVLVSKYPASVQMSSPEFIRVCNYLSNFDEGHISVTSGNVLKFFATGDDGLVKANYMKTKASATVVSVQEPVSMTVDLKYMNTFVKLSAVCKQVKIFLSNTHPLFGECKIGQMGSYIRYFLSPKGNSETEEEEIKEERELGSTEKEGSKKIKGVETTSDGSE